MMYIRKTETGDIPRMLGIFKAARRFMRCQGNMTQWPDTYPSAETIHHDIDLGQSYVIESNGTPVGTFVLALGEEPTYAEITDGKWPDARPYATIHRIASDGSVKGIADAALRFARSELNARGIGALRIDTHRDNRPMLSWIESRGFACCGIIRVWDGTPRLAYQLTL